MSVMERPQDRARAFFSDRTGQGTKNRLGFSLFRHKNQELACSQQCRDGQCNRVGWHLLNGLEMPFSYLLAARSLSQLDDFHPARILEIGIRWIIKCDMSVFTDSHHAQVRRMGK